MFCLDYRGLPNRVKLTRALRGERENIDKSSVSLHNIRMNQKKVLVFLSTYNGERFLREQIDSILAQKGVEVFIRASDDRSTDSTPDILAKYKQAHSNFDYYINEVNRGFTYNFLDNLYSANGDSFDYFAFADQDDVWLEDKLLIAIEHLEKMDSPHGNLYCSNLRLVDANLNPIGMQEGPAALKIKKHMYLTANIATGCTIVFDRALFLQTRKHHPESIYLHDYWMLLVAVFTGGFYYDIEGHILYRQHGNNQIGSNKSFFTKGKMSAFLHPKHRTSDLLSEFHRLYKEDLNAEDERLIDIAAHYRQSFKK